MLRVELRRSLRRWRVWVLAAALAAVPSLIVLGLVLNPPPPGVGDGLFSLALANGLFSPLAALVVVQPFLLPLAAALLAGDSLAGEQSGGTLRYLLVVPVRRSTLVLAKVGAVVALLALVIAALAVVGLLIGGIAFGLGPLPTLSGTTLTLAEGLGRLALASGYALAGASALGVIGVWLSSLTSSGPAATATTVGVAIVLQIIGAIEPLAAVRPFLLTTYWPRLLELFRAPVAWQPLVEGLVVFAAYAVVFLALALRRVARRDVDD
jgi:ABC-2 type transport system permease protein